MGEWWPADEAWPDGCSGGCVLLAGRRCWRRDVCFIARIALRLVCIIVGYGAEAQCFMENVCGGEVVELK